MIAPWVRADVAPAATPVAMRTVSEPQTLGIGGSAVAPRRRGLPIGVILGGMAVMALAGGGAAWLLLRRGSHGYGSGTVATGLPSASSRSARKSPPVPAPIPVEAPAAVPRPATVPAPAPALPSELTPARPVRSLPILSPRSVPPISSEKQSEPSLGATAGTGGLSSVQSPAAAEMALHLSTAQRQAVQTSLQALGYNTGGRDGDFGPMTRAAIAAYQVRRGMTPNGFLTASIVKELLRNRPQRVRPVASIARPVRTGPASVGSPITHAVACQLPPDGHTEMLSPATCRQRGGLLD